MMISKNFRIFSAIVVSCASFNPTLARADVYCSGSINQTYTDVSGNVVIYAPWRGDWTAICNLNYDWKAVKPATCFGWFSSVSTALVNGKGIIIYYTGSQVNCTTLQTYAESPAPFYIRLTSP